MSGVGKALGQSSGAVWRGCSVLFLPLVPQSPAELSSLHTPPSFLLSEAPMHLHTLTLASTSLGVLTQVVLTTSPWLGLLGKNQT